MLRLTILCCVVFASTIYADSVQAENCLQSDDEMYMCICFGGEDDDDDGFGKSVAAIHKFTSLLECSGGCETHCTSLGATPYRDCDNENATVNPAASEICEDGVDNDCDGSTDESDCEAASLDCNGALGGGAFIDECGDCVGGATGKTAYTQDCNGEWGGTAVTDVCGDCVGGTTGKTACTQDCNGDWGGAAYTDGCGDCVGGNTGKTACANNDCAGIPGGRAYTDNCNQCVGGTTGRTACAKDCNGTWGGNAYADNCGVCVGGSSGNSPCTQDCHGTWGGNAFTDNCNQCVGGKTGLRACAQDCTGKWGGTAFLDDCGDCVGGSTGLEKCEPITDITVTGGASLAEYSGRVRLGPLLASDVRSRISHTFTLVTGEGDTDNKAFRILRENGASWLSPWASFDYESGDSLSVRIQAADRKGNTFAKSVTVSVTDVVDAPIVAQGVIVPLPSAAADSQSGDGTPVTGLFGNVTVSSSSAPEGVAVCYADNSNGNWQYTTDDGATWVNLSTVSETPSDVTGAARILSGAAGNRVRFVPNPGFAGAAEIRFHLWNGEGWYRNGIMADVTKRPGSGDFSQEFVSATVTVEPDETWIGELFASVADEDGLPVADAQMSLASVDGACLRNGLSNASGEFLFEMLPLADDYLLSVSGPDGSGLGDAEAAGISVSEQAAMTEIMLPESDDADCDLCGDAPPNPSSAVLSEAGPGEITGRVADIDGTLPPENMILSVKFFEKDGGFLKRVTVSSDGTFRATGLDPEKEYQLKVKVIGSNLAQQWVKYLEGFGFSFGVGGDRGLAGAYAPGTAVSIVMNRGWLW